MSIGHLYVSDVSVLRQSDNVWFRFKTYCLKPGQWGFELVAADGHRTSNVSDPDWGTEHNVKEWLDESIDLWERTEGYGWVLEETSPVVEARPAFRR